MGGHLSFFFLMPSRGMLARHLIAAGEHSHLCTFLPYHAWKYRPSPLLSGVVVPQLGCSFVWTVQEMGGCCGVTTVHMFVALRTGPEGAGELGASRRETAWCVEVAEGASRAAIRGLGVWKSEPVCGMDQLVGVECAEGR